MGYSLKDEFVLSFVLKNGEEISDCCEQVSTNHDEVEWIRNYTINYGPYDFATCATPLELAKMVKRSVVQTSYTINGNERYCYFYDENSSLYREIEAIPSMKDIKSISLKAKLTDLRSPGEMPMDYLEHNFDIEKMEYKIILQNENYEFMSITPHFHGMRHDDMHSLGYRTDGYSYKTNSLICPNCGKVLDKDTFYIDSKEHKIYCHEDCSPESFYSFFRAVRGSVSDWYELIKTGIGKRAETIENILPGDRLTFKLHETEKGKSVEIFCEEKSIGFISKEDTERFLYYPQSGCDDIECELLVKRVTPLSKMSKGKRKPEVEILQVAELKTRKKTGKQYRIATVTIDGWYKAYDYICDDESIQPKYEGYMRFGDEKKKINVIDVKMKYESELNLPLGMYKKLDLI